MEVVNQNQSTAHLIPTIAALVVVEAPQVTAVTLLVIRPHQIPRLIDTVVPLAVTEGLVTQAALSEVLEEEVVVMVQMGEVVPA